LIVNIYYLILNNYDDIIIDKNKEAFKLGSSIANKLILEFSGKSTFLTRVHDGEGALLGLRSLFSKSQPMPSEILLGLGKGLAEDDYAERLMVCLR
jgi:hypothetical protein